MPNDLTHKQNAFYKTLLDLAKRGSMPTYRQIVEELGYKSPNSVTQNYKALLKKGYLTHDEVDGYRFASNGQRVCPHCGRVL